MYLALYRKYRPRTFDDVISQPEIVTTLKNQISEGNNAHAYLFTGSRGTGKTTCAKILAMALNCKHPVNGNPCLECENCREIAEGKATDIVEMDAASNRGVNDVHDMQDQLAYTPVSCKYRVYILDEVHMFTVDAFNALLKTLEEPPAHVIFILATTELHKVPATILSRCQRFEFRRIDIADSSARLLSIAGQEGFSLSQEAADMISRISDGGMRDALSLLDRCIAVSRDVTEEVVRNCAGVADNHHLYLLAEMTAQRNIPGCIQLLEQLYKGGKDIARVMDELAGVFRDLMICKSAPAEKGLLSAMPHDHPEIERLAGLFSLDDILRCLTLIQECTDNIARSRSRRTLAEMCFVKLCTGAPTAAQAAAAKTVGAVSQSVNAQNFAKPAASKPMGSEFTPLPDDKLDPSRAATVNKLREIFNRNEAPAEKPEPVREAKPAAPEKPAISPAPAKQEKTPPADLPFDIGEPKKTDVPDAAKPAAPAVPDAPASAKPAAPDIPPLPEMNSRPAAPEAEYILPEEPPVEYTPPREFATAPEPQTAPAQPAEPAKPVKPSVKAETPAKSGEIKTESKKSAEPEASPAPDTGYTKLVSLTQEEWSQIIEKVPSPLYGAMLDGSTATVNEDGVLEIHTGNLMLQGIVSDGCQELEKELAGAFGKKIRARVVGEEQENTDEEKDLPVKQLLDKARQLNIEVDIK